MKIKLDEFTRQYIETALWASDDDADIPLDENYKISDLSEEALEEAIADCKKFQEQFAELLARAGNDSQNGHDFWLTRNQHGAGFWDRGYDEDVSDGLKDACHWQGEFGECCLYVGDDGKIYF